MIRSNITSGQWWRVVGDFWTPITEALTRAKKADERETGHDCGHTFRIRVEGRLHSSGVVTDNPPVHSDADWWHDDGTVEVRAHNLRDALLLAAALPMTAWPGLADTEADR